MTDNPMPPGFYNMDCMAAMKQFPDGFFDLAIVDPPYGDGGGSSQVLNVSANGSTATAIRKIGGGCIDHLHSSQRKRERERETASGRHYTFGLRKKDRNYKTRRDMGGEIRKKIISWDIAPGEDYFKELFRVSRNQIIWGANYFQLPPSRNFVVWDKPNISESFSMASCEYAWVSINGNAKIWRGVPNGQAGRFHPTQKPIALYEWLLSRFAKPGDKILDTHVGSASSLIACHRAGLMYWGFEIDPEYYRLATERMNKETAQVSFVDIAPETQTQLFIGDK